MSELVSYFLVGRFENDPTRLFCQRLKEDVVPEELSLEDIAALIRICHRANALPVCTIRSRFDENNDIEHFHSYFSDPPTAEDERIRLNALLWIAKDFDATKVRQAVEDANTLASLGFGGVE
jgi:hypothetical protein